MNHDRLLDDIHDLVRKYVSFPNAHAAVVTTLWIAHTWCVMAFFTTPRLIIQSPEPGSGKSRLLELLALLCRSAKITLNASPAALYRRISSMESPPTILQDEFDGIFGAKASSSAEDTRVLFNAGYRKGATVDRCEGDGAKMKVAEFKVYAAVAMAGLGSPPRTITTRGVTIAMRKRAPGEKVSPYRERDALDEAAPIVEGLREWAEQNFDALAAARPDMPMGVVDRPAEVWEPLLAVADNCGGRWPELARAACRHYVLSVPDETASMGVRLLAAVQSVFRPDGQQQIAEMHSSDIVDALIKDPDSPWRDLWGKPLDQRRLATELRKYEVRPKQLRIGGKVAKGYITGPHSDRDGDSVGLDDAWRRYLTPDSRNSRNSRNTAGQPVTDSVTDDHPVELSVTASVTESAPVTCTVTDVSLVTDAQGRGAPSPTAMPSHASPPALITSRRARTRGKFRAPTGLGRCTQCGWHTPTQGHAPDCITANEATA